MTTASPPEHQKPGSQAASSSNFLRQIVEDDLKSGKWGGRVATRFPPEPNGYLHIGHAKSICLNFGLARDYGGVCHMRFDDTNPLKEEQEYADSILDAVRWLGFDWGEHLYHASDYFPRFYAFAEHLIVKGKAYVDDLTPEQMREYRGTLTQPGRDSPWRNRPVEENLDLFRRMKAGEFPDGSKVLRAKIDMASPNMNLRDPAIYRVRHAEHHRTGKDWCIYPMYDYAHCISDALERITHSICTLEFEDHRPLYDWVLDELAEVLPWHSRQYEFARLNLTYTVMSKRKLIQLVADGHVEGWDDPRMSTIVGLRRRGYTPEAIRLFAERIGVSKADSWIDFSMLEECLREDLNERAQRRVAVLRPLKLVIDNYPGDLAEECFAPNHPQKPELGRRVLPFSRELWIEQEDFTESPPKGYFRLSPGAEVRLRYAYIVKCVGVEKDAQGRPAVVHCTYDPETKSGTAGAEKRKVKGNIHWVCARHALAAPVRLYDRLFAVPFPGSRKGRETLSPAATARQAYEDADESGKVHAPEAPEEYDWLDDINPDSKEVLSAWCEPALAQARPEERFQFERHGYFVADRVESKEGAPVFNRAVTLKDSWAKQGG